MMRNIWTIAKREYKIYFSSPLGYIVMLLIVGTIGGVFALTLISLTSSPFGGGPAPDSSIVTNPMGILLVISAPALTMRLLADEQRMGTLELMLTAPVRDWELVVGKWLGSLLYLLTAVAMTLIFLLFTNSMVTPGIDQQVMLSGYLGVVLLASASLAIGVGISSLFSNQFAAFFVSLFVLLFIMWWLIGVPAQLLPASGEFFRYLDIKTHYYPFTDGVINLSDIVYFLSVTALGLFIGSVAIETRRWR
jgi:ABC-2 type transport system permease protein